MGHGVNNFRSLMWWEKFKEVKMTELRESAVFQSSSRQAILVLGLTQERQCH
jgi:hypothetical protein